MDYGHVLVTELQIRSIRAKHTQTVDEFLDLNCRERVHLVSVAINVLDTDTLDNIKLLRTHFGEGPGTRIVATSSFMPGATPIIVEQRGADKCMTKPREPEVMAAALEAELCGQMKSEELGRADDLDRSE